MTALQVYEYASNNPANRTDPEGLEDLVVRTGAAYWAVEKQGWFVDADVEEIYIGAVTGDEIRLSPAFGGQIISVTAATALAKAHIYLDKLIGSARRDAIRDAFAGRGVSRSGESLVGAAFRGTGRGVQAGGASILNALALGQSEAFRRSKEYYHRRAGTQGTWVETATDIAAGTGVAAGYAAFALDVAATYGFSEIGTVVLQDLGAQAYIEGSLILATGNPLAYWFQQRAIQKEALSRGVSDGNAQLTAAANRLADRIAQINDNIYKVQNDAKTWKDAPDLKDSVIRELVGRRDELSRQIQDLFK